MRLRNLAIGASAMAVAIAVNPASAQVTTTTQQTTTTSATVGTQDIIGTLKAAGNFTMFLKAVDMAGLTAQLQGTGPFTVFAPTDEAFSRIPAATRDSLLADHAALEALVKNHVVSGKITADEVRKGNAGVGFMGGTPLNVDTTGSSVKVNGASVVKGNIVATNGIVHAIDTVYLSEPTVPSAMPADPAKPDSTKPKP